MLNEMLAQRELPSLLTLNEGRAAKTPDDWRIRRRELIDILSREEYGYTPAAPDRVKGQILPDANPRAFAGKASQQRIELLRYIAVLSAHVGLSHAFALKPFVILIITGFLRPVLRQPVPWDTLPVRAIRPVYKDIELPEPWQHLGLPVHLPESDRRCVMRSSAR